MASRNDRVVVCGAGGFIGGHLVAKLWRDGYTDIRAVDWKPFDEWLQRVDGADNRRLDLSGIEPCREAVDGAAVVYNLASDMGGIGFIQSHKALCMLSVLINTHLLQASSEQHIDRYFFSSSACVYRADKQGDPHATALKESDAYPAMPEDGYGWEKLFSERMCRHFRQDFGVQTRVARYHNVYGPLCLFEGGREKAPAAICRKVIEAQLTGQRTIEIWGDGTQTRSFMYVDDCLDGTVELTASDVVEPLNVGSGELVTIDELVDVIEDVAGIHLRRSYNLDAPRGVAGRNSDNTSFRDHFGWEPDTKLREGLEQTYRWIYDAVAPRYA
jgi:nucleoside-diphosphate-sugar epimerase